MTHLPRPSTRAVAVWYRNLLVWRKLIGPAVVMNFGEPVLYLLAFGYGIGFFVGDMDGVAYLSFLASGIVASTVMTTATFEGMYSVYSRMVPQKTYDAILATPLDLDDIIAGEMLWCATKGLLSGIAVLIVGLAIGAISRHEAWLVLPSLFLTGLCFAGPAMVMSAIATSYDFFTYYYTLVVTPMFLLSGVFYPVETLPAGVQPLVHVLPLSHAVALVRPPILGGELEAPVLHVAVLVAYAIAGFYVAAVLARRRLLV